MPHYLIQASLTPEAMAAAIKNPQNRREAVRPVIEGMGGHLEAYYFAFGEHDAYVLVEMPDNVSAAAIAMAVGASGALKSYQTTVLMTAEEAMEAMRKAGGVGYRPPG
ncbi:MAG: GYD domain-containing protein [Dehalococcoidia bacterium]